MSGKVFKYGGRLRRRFAIWRRIQGADCNMEADSGGRFHMEVNYGGKLHYGGLFLHDGGRFILLVKAKPLILCLCSTTRGGLNN
jgi:hypothetical protein